VATSTVSSIKGKQLPTHSVSIEILQCHRAVSLRSTVLI